MHISAAINICLFSTNAVQCYDDRNSSSVLTNNFKMCQNYFQNNTVKYPHPSFLYAINICVYEKNQMKYFITES